MGTVKVTIFAMLALDFLLLALPVEFVSGQGLAWADSLPAEKDE